MIQEKRRFATLVQSRFSIIKSYYGTGGDLNVDEIHEVIPTEEWCMASPRGVFNGHFKPTEADKINRIGQLRQGVVKVIENQNSPDVAKKKKYRCRYDYWLWRCRSSS
jgi:signal peptidase I